MKKILIIDDDRVMIKLLEFNFKPLGYEVISMQNGDNFIENLKLLMPNLIILDYYLPGKSGLELLEMLKKERDFFKIPVIMITGQGKESTHDALINAGADQIFTKPFSPRTLTKKVAELLTVYENRTYGQHNF